MIAWNWKKKSTSKQRFRHNSYAYINYVSKSIAKSDLDNIDVFLTELVSGKNIINKNKIWPIKSYYK